MRRGAIALAALVVSLLLLGVALSGRARADDGQEVQARTPQKGQPLVVPVYPLRPVDKKEPGPDSEDVKLPEGADLRDSYVVMEDGSVLSVADWVLGSLSKHKTGAGMSDYENRLFLGKVARSLMGQSEDLVNRSVTDVGPVIPYRAGGVPKSMASEALAFAIKPFLVEMPEGWTPATTGGGFSPRAAFGGDAAILFEEQFAQATSWTVDEFKEAGIMRVMLRDYLKKNPDIPAPKE